MHIFFCNAKVTPNIFGFKDLVTVTKARCLNFRTGVFLDSPGREEKIIIRWQYHHLTVSKRYIKICYGFKITQMLTMMKPL